MCPPPFKLPDTPCRTRFAPSPTGYLHLGSLRTALFNYLFAKATGGQFILRIEDTDQTRLVADAEERLYQDLEWLGLSWDEGPDKNGPYGPYRQSERLPLYKEHSDKLIREEKAYRCFCTPESLEAHRTAAEASGQPTIYPGTCSHVPLAESDARAQSGEKYAVRFKSSEKPIMIRDVVYNRFQKKEAEEDFIIMKRDGFPTYHFANVVDDRHMKITHVIRGAEWLISTPKHVELYNAFGWEPPQFVHLGLLVDANRQKLSKRDNSANMEFYKKGHVLPSALLNFAVLLGWRAPQTPKGDVMTLQDMADNFSLKFSKGDIIVSLSKLPFLQDKHLDELLTTPSSPLIHSHLLTPLRTALATFSSAQLPLPPKDRLIGPSPPASPLLTDPSYLPLVRRLLLSAKLDTSDPARRFADAVPALMYFFWPVPEAVLEGQLRGGQLAPVAPAERAMHLASAVEVLRSRLAALDGETAWTVAGLQRVIEEVRGDREYREVMGVGEGEDGLKQVYLPLRWALFAMNQGSPMAVAMEVLGKEETLRRLGVAKHVAETVEAAVARPEGKEKVEGQDAA
ncbi:glutamyl-tRNA synthetase [Staphylotrichum tortipilum]|uniref:Glutamate--tRNA ligase, mitochondrial n=1 Tax=Staphylotrichum tortipilum TaxID=2831512 RepID=A0AAN6MHW5_9PEZI|nr:glutamyl-tRNA synthetase [Staphylotrichum longicolle]